MEVVLKYYNAGDYEQMHYHKIATEITVIAKGSVEMNGQFYGQGDIIVISSNEATDFRALDDVITVVVKHPSSTNDKYIGEPK